MPKKTPTKQKKTKIEIPPGDDPKNWPPLRRGVEALNQLKALIEGPTSVIPESLVRRTLAGQHGCKPEDVTWNQLRLGISELVKTYPRIHISGASLRSHVADETSPPKSASPASSKARLSGQIDCPAAARKLEAYLKANGIGQTDFASQAQTTDRTLRSFRTTGKVRRDIFESIAKAMGTTKEELLKA
jgi:hypothetical protein